MVGKVTKWLLCGAVVATSLIASGHAHATLIAGTAAFSDAGPSGNGLSFTGTFNPSNSFSFNLTSGTPVIIPNFLTITSHDTGGFFGSAAADNIATTFSFTQPGIGSGSVNGVGSEVTAAFLGLIVGADGSIHWGGPAVIDFGGGLVLDILLTDASFSNTGFPADPDQSVNIAAILNLQDGTHAGPEPASIALFGAGLLGLGLLKRRRDRV